MGGGEEGGPRAGFQEKSMILDIEVFMCKTYIFCLFLYHMYRSSWWPVFGDSNRTG